MCECAIIFVNNAPPFPYSFLDTSLSSVFLWREKSGSERIDGCVKMEFGGCPILRFYRLRVAVATENRRR